MDGFGSDFGQKVDLTASIRNILRNYPEGTAVLKELIQNADDASARHVKFILDCRHLPSSKLPSHTMESFQGPSLLVYNDAIFTKEDFESIQRIGDSLKNKDEEEGGGTTCRGSGSKTKIGRFGIGFNAVYHWTDLPSFLSDEYLVLLDPHAKFLPNVNPSNPGKILSYLKEKGCLEKFSDLFLGYNLPSIVDYSKKFHGTLFRLPLRSKEQAKESNLSKREIRVEDLIEILKQLSKELSSLILFLRKIEHIEVFIWRENGDLEEISSVSINSSLLTESFRAFRSYDEVLSQMKGKISSVTSTSSASVFSSLIKKYDFTLMLNCKHRLGWGPSNDETVDKLDIESSTSSSTFTSYQEVWEVCTQFGGEEVMKISHNPENLHLKLVPIGGVAACVSHPPSSITSSALENKRYKGQAGQAYCFLPLPINTYLPIMLNGFFELSSNRRDIWQRSEDMRGDGTSRAEWNESLLKDLLSECYIRLLEKMKNHVISKKITYEEYERYWPNLKTSVPFSLLSSSLYDKINKKELFYSFSSLSWISLASSSLVPSDLLPMPGIDINETKNYLNILFLLLKDNILVIKNLHLYSSLLSSSCASSLRIISSKYLRNVLREFERLRNEKKNLITKGGDEENMITLINNVNKNSEIKNYLNFISNNQKISIKSLKTFFFYYLLLDITLEKNHLELSNLNILPLRSTQKYGELIFYSNDQIEMIQSLLSMGYSYEFSLLALLYSKFDLDQALNFLLSTEKKEIILNIKKRKRLSYYLLIEKSSSLEDENHIINLAKNTENETKNDKKESNLLTFLVKNKKLKKIFLNNDLILMNHYKLLFNKNFLNCSNIKLFNFFYFQDLFYYFLPISFFISPFISYSSFSPKFSSNFTTFLSHFWSYICLHPESLSYINDYVAIVPVLQNGKIHEKEINLIDDEEEEISELEDEENQEDEIEMAREINSNIKDQLYFMPLSRFSNIIAKERDGKSLPPSIISLLNTFGIPILEIPAMNIQVDLSLSSNNSLANTSLVLPSKFWEYIHPPTSVGVIKSLTYYRKHINEENYIKLSQSLEKSSIKSIRNFLFSYLDLSLLDSDDLVTISYLKLFILLVNKTKVNDEIEKKTEENEENNEHYISLYSIENPFTFSDFSFNINKLFLYQLDNDEEEINHEKNASNLILKYKSENELNLLKKLNIKMIKKTFFYKEIIFPSALIYLARNFSEYISFLSSFLLNLSPLIKEDPSFSSYLKIAPIIPTGELDWILENSENSLDLSNFSPSFLKPIQDLYDPTDPSILLLLSPSFFPSHYLRDRQLLVVFSSYGLKSIIGWKELVLCAKLVESEAYLGMEKQQTRGRALFKYLDKNISRLLGEDEIEREKEREKEKEREREREKEKEKEKSKGFFSRITSFVSSSLSVSGSSSTTLSAVEAAALLLKEATPYLEELKNIAWVPYLINPPAPLYDRLPWKEEFRIEDSSNKSENGAKIISYCVPPNLTSSPQNINYSSSSLYISELNITSPSMNKIFSWKNFVTSLVAANQIVHYSIKFSEVEEERRLLRKKRERLEKEFNKVDDEEEIKKMLEEVNNEGEKLDLVIKEYHTILNSSLFLLYNKIDQDLNQASFSTTSPSGVQNSSLASSLTSVLSFSPWIWTDGHFASPSQVAVRGTLFLPPYLFKLPDELRAMKNIINYFNIKNDFLVINYIDVLDKMFHDHLESKDNEDGTEHNNEKQSTLYPSSTPLPSSLLDFSISLITLISQESQDFLSDKLIYAPDKQGKLYLSSTLLYDDVPWIKDASLSLSLSTSGSTSTTSPQLPTRFLHNNISSFVADKIGAKSLRLTLLSQSLSSNIFTDNSMINSTSTLLPSSTSSIQSFGQSESITNRIRTILDLYPEGSPILNELIQNADDAGAKKVKILIDENSYPSVSLMSSSLEPLQGPSLLVYNDKSFSEEDFKHLVSVGQGSKLNKISTTGKFGLGFNSIYHLTDTPCLLSDSYFLFLDPHCEYVPGAQPSQPGIRINYLQNDLIQTFPHQFSCFSFFNFNSKEKYHGSLFRFPLRTDKQAKSSLISKESITVRDLYKIIDQNLEQFHYILLYLRSVESIEIYSCKEGEKEPRLLHVVTKSTEINQNKTTDKKDLLRYLQDKRVASAFTSAAPRSSFPNPNTSQEDFYDILSRTSDEDLPIEYSTVYITSKIYNTEKIYTYKRIQGLGGGKVKELACETNKKKKTLLKLVPFGGVSICYSVEERNENKGISSSLVFLPSLDGKLFCFLPLPSRTTLPFFINGYWELSANRRDLWEGEDSQGVSLIKASWNLSLMEDLVAKMMSLLVSEISEEFFKLDKSEENIENIKEMKKTFLKFLPTTSVLSPPILKALNLSNDSSSIVTTFSSNVGSNNSSITSTSITSTASSSPWDRLIIKFYYYLSREKLFSYQVNKENKYNIVERKDISTSSYLFLSPSECLLLSSEDPYLNHLSFLSIDSPHELLEHLLNQEKKYIITLPPSLIECFTLFSQGSTQVVSPLIIREIYRKKHDKGEFVTFSSTLSLNLLYSSFLLLYSISDLLTKDLNKLYEISHHLHHLPLLPLANGSLGVIGDVIDLEPLYFGNKTMRKFLNKSESKMIREDLLGIQENIFVNSTADIVPVSTPSTSSPTISFSNFLLTLASKKLTNLHILDPMATVALLRKHLPFSWSASSSIFTTYEGVIEKEWLLSLWQYIIENNLYDIFEDVFPIIPILLPSIENSPNSLISSKIFYPNSISVNILPGLLRILHTLPVLFFTLHSTITGYEKENIKNIPIKNILIKLLFNLNIFILDEKNSSINLQNDPKIIKNKQRVQKNDIKSEVKIVKNPKEVSKIEDIEEKIEEILLKIILEETSKQSFVSPSWNQVEKLLFYSFLFNDLLKKVSPSFLQNHQLSSLSKLPIWITYPSFSLSTELPIVRFPNLNFFGEEKNELVHQEESNLLSSLSIISIPSISSFFIPPFDLDSPSLYSEEYLLLKTRKDIEIYKLIGFKEISNHEFFINIIQKITNEQAEEKKRGNNFIPRYSKEDILYISKKILTTYHQINNEIKKDPEKENIFLSSKIFFSSANTLENIESFYDLSLLTNYTFLSSSFFPSSSYYSSTELKILKDIGLKTMIKPEDILKAARDIEKYYDELLKDMELVDEEYMTIFEDEKNLNVMDDEKLKNNKIMREVNEKKKKELLNKSSSLLNYLNNHIDNLLKEVSEKRDEWIFELRSIKWVGIEEEHDQRQLGLPWKNKDEIFMLSPDSSSFTPVSSASLHSSSASSHSKFYKKSKKFLEAPSKIRTRENLWMISASSYINSVEITSESLINLFQWRENISGDILTNQLIEMSRILKKYRQEANSSPQAFNNLTLVLQNYNAHFFSIFSNLSEAYLREEIEFYKENILMKEAEDSENEEQLNNEEYQRNKQKILYQPSYLHKLRNNPCILIENQFFEPYKLSWNKIRRVNVEPFLYILSSSFSSFKYFLNPLHVRNHFTSNDLLYCMKKMKESLIVSSSSTSIEERALTMQELDQYIGLVKTFYIIFKKEMIKKFKKEEEIKVEHDEKKSELAIGEVEESNLQDNDNKIEEKKINEDDEDDEDINDKINLKFFAYLKSSLESLQLYLPSLQNTLVSSKELAYNDTPWLSLSTLASQSPSISLVNPRIKNQEAEALGCQSLRQFLLKNETISCPNIEILKQIIKKNEEDYDTNLNINLPNQPNPFQQNSEKKKISSHLYTSLMSLVSFSNYIKSKEVQFIFDFKSYEKESLLHPGLAELQGPALLVYYPSSSSSTLFTTEEMNKALSLNEENFTSSINFTMNHLVGKEKNIEKRRSSSGKKYAKINNGEGLLPSFNITDCLQVYSSSSLYVFDPSQSFLQEDYYDTLSEPPSHSTNFNSISSSPHPPSISSLASSIYSPISNYLSPLPPPPPDTTSSSISQPLNGIGLKFSFKNKEEKFFSSSFHDQFSSLEPLGEEFRMKFSSSSNINGVLLRLPLREKPSSISSKVLTKDEINKVIDELRNSLSASLLFSEILMKISFSIYDTSENVLSEIKDEENIEKRYSRKEIFSYELISDHFLREKRYEIFEDYSWMKTSGITSFFTKKPSVKIHQQKYQLKYTHSSNSALETWLICSINGHNSLASLAKYQNFYSLGVLPYISIAYCISLSSSLPPIGLAMNSSHLIEVTGLPFHIDGQFLSFSSSFLPPTSPRPSSSVLLTCSISQYEEERNNIISWNETLYAAAYRYLYLKTIEDIREYILDNPLNIYKYFIYSPTLTINKTNMKFLPLSYSTSPLSASSSLPQPVFSTALSTFKFYEKLIEKEIFYLNKSYINGKGLIFTESNISNKKLIFFLTQFYSVSPSSSSSPPQSSSLLLLDSPSQIYHDFNENKLPLKVLSPHFLRQALHQSSSKSSLILNKFPIDVAESLLEYVLSDMKEMDEIFSEEEKKRMKDRYKELIKLKILYSANKSLISFPLNSSSFICKVPLLFHLLLPPQTQNLLLYYNFGSSLKLMNDLTFLTSVNIYELSPNSFHILIPYLFNRIYMNSVLFFPTSDSIEYNTSNELKFTSENLELILLKLWSLPPFLKENEEFHLLRDAPILPVTIRGKRATIPCFYSKFILIGKEKEDQKNYRINLSSKINTLEENGKSLFISTSTSSSNNLISINWNWTMRTRRDVLEEITGSRFSLEIESNVGNKHIEENSLPQPQFSQQSTSSEILPTSSSSLSTMAASLASAAGAPVSDSSSLYSDPSVLIILEKLGIPFFDYSLAENCPKGIGLNSSTSSSTPSELFHLLYFYLKNSYNFLSIDEENDQENIDGINFNLLTVQDRKKLLLIFYGDQEIRHHFLQYLEGMKELPLFTSSFSSSNSPSLGISLNLCKKGVYWIKDVKILENLPESIKKIYLGGTESSIQDAQSLDTSIYESPVILYSDQDLEGFYSLLNIEELTLPLLLKSFFLNSYSSLSSLESYQILHFLAVNWKDYREDREFLTFLIEKPLIPKWNLEDPSAWTQDRSSDKNLRKVKELLSWKMPSSSSLSSSFLSFLKPRENPSYFPPILFQSDDFVPMFNDLGINYSLTKDIILDIAKNIDENNKKLVKNEQYSINLKDLISFSKSFINFLFSSSDNINIFLQQNNFLDILFSYQFIPLRYPLPIQEGGLLSFNSKLGKLSECILPAEGELFFTVLPILEEELVPNHTINGVLLKYFNKNNNFRTVFKHFEQLISCKHFDLWNPTIFSSPSPSSTSSLTSTKYSIISIFNSIYSYFESNFSSLTEENISFLKSSRVIPINNLLLSPSHIFFHNISDEFFPFLCQFPLEFGQHKSFLLKIGVKNEPLLSDYLFFLSELSNEIGLKRLNPNELKAVVEISKKIEEILENKSEDSSLLLNNLYLPNELNQLIHKNFLLYNDNNNLKKKISSALSSTTNSLNFTFLNPIYSLSFSKHFNIISLTDVIHEEEEDIKQIYDNNKLKIIKNLKNNTIISCIYSLLLNSTSKIPDSSSQSMNTNSSGSTLLNLSEIFSKISTISWIFSSTLTINYYFLNSINKKKYLLYKKSNNYYYVNKEENLIILNINKLQDTASINFSLVLCIALCHYFDLESKYAPVIQVLLDGLGEDNAEDSDNIVAIYRPKVMKNEDIVVLNQEINDQLTNTNDSLTIINDLLDISSDLSHLEFLSRGSPGVKLNSEDFNMLELRPQRVFQIGEIVALKESDEDQSPYIYGKVISMSSPLDFGVRNIEVKVGNKTNKMLLSTNVYTFKSGRSSSSEASNLSHPPIDIVQAASPSSFSSIIPSSSPSLTSASSNKLNQKDQRQETLKAIQGMMESVGLSLNMNEQDLINELLEVKKLNKQLEEQFQKEKNLQQKTINKIKKKIDDFACPICLDNFSNFTLVPCGHLICGQCCQKVNSCPLCRKSINQKLKLILPIEDEDNVEDEETL